MENINIRKMIKLKEAWLEILEDEIIKIYQQLLKNLWYSQYIKKLERWFFKKNWEIKTRNYFLETHSKTRDLEPENEEALWIIKIHLDWWKEILLSTENHNFRKDIKWVRFLDKILSKIDPIKIHYIISQINELKDFEKAYFQRKREKIIKQTKKTLAESF